MQAQEKPGKRSDSLKESQLFPQTKGIYGGLARTSRELLLYNLSVLCLPEDLLSLFTLINLASITKLLLLECS